MKSESAIREELEALKNMPILKCQEPRYDTVQAEIEAKIYILKWVLEEEDNGY